MSVMSVSELITALNQGAVDFDQVMQVIDQYYEFSPARFVNGDTVNEAGSNNGSCKIFAFAKLNQLSEQATLNAFGDFYTVDVLQHPEAEDHQNIRNFMQYGWQGIQFDRDALAAKS
ncbi:HopJ type III effector protein [Thiomicrorhabdus sp. zzn3]|uniref:HopJ type III effector protein n=1 Tax=Thiomicrorhabdus sp. zzn3 TaxID=3039775 RepID=UPI0024367DFB|nr:HopJ type III effector protein [Thiomicrorhabdus sp. zzn3]MDG6778023.1 HopJ type III effector protein [Thiomicrorhabdus sp. zzn3]